MKPPRRSPRALAATLLAALALLAPAQAGAASAAVPSGLQMLQALIRTQAINPPGNETPAVGLIAGWLSAAGIPYHVYASGPHRASVVARLKAAPGSNPKQAVMLLGHLDVVPVEASRWKHPPFAAIVEDGKLYGRGTLDMQGLDVMELQAFLQLARARTPLKRDVVLALTADEEAGGDYGVGWLLKHHPDDVACAELINEGGAGLQSDGGTSLMGIQVAERGMLWVKVTATGTPGHGAQERPDSAPRRLLRALARLENRQRNYELGPETTPMLAAYAGAMTGVKRLAIQALIFPGLLPLVAPVLVGREPTVGPLLDNTVNPTVLSCGQKVNVIPSEASVEVDIRILPGRTVAGTLGWLKQVLDDPTLRVEVSHASEPSRSPTDGRVYQALADATHQVYPGVQVTPILTPGGGTDSAFFRRVGVKCYGCLPIMASADQITAIHGDNEFITLRQLEDGMRVMQLAVTQAVAR